MLAKLLTRRLFHNPIFVVGEGRSGTSVLLQALGKHPLILSVQGEAPLITSIGSIVHLFEFSDKVKKDYHLRALQCSKGYLYDHLRRLCFEICAGKEYGLKRVMKRFLYNPISFFKICYWANKTFPSEDVANALLRLYPTGKFIYIVRNGIEVVHSKTRFHSFRDIEFRQHCQSWKNHIEKYRYMKGIKSAIQVRHEEMVKNPDEVFRKIFAFLGIAYRNNPAEFVKTTIVHPLDEATHLGINVQELFAKRRPPYENWSSEQRDLFNSICGESMREVGYELPF